MLVVGAIVCLVLFVFLQALIFDAQRHGKDVYSSDFENLTLEDLITDSVLENWISDSPVSTPWKAGTTQHRESATGEKHSSKFSPVNETVQKPGQNATHGAVVPTVAAELQSDDSSVSSPAPSKDQIIHSLFTLPSQEVEGDWAVVLGTFDHFDDENWNNFLIKTEVPFLVRMFLSDSSETVTISRDFKGSKKDTKQDKKSSSPKATASDFEVTIETSSWLLTHVSKFRLGETYIEHDLDGTDSKNTFFFSSPRLLVHNKIKDKWRTAIVRHFDETGLNMTFVDRDRKVTARRFFKRIK